MRRGISIAGAVIALALPASSLAASRVYVGDFAGATSQNASLVFQASGKLSKHLFIPRRVSDFDVTVQFSCFDAAGHQVSSAQRDDLAPGFFGGQKVRKNGTFQGSSMTPTGLTYTGSGRLHKGKARGVLAITQGQRGGDGYCSTGTFADPGISWTAKATPPACGSSAALPVARCVNPNA